MRKQLEKLEGKNEMKKSDTLIKIAIALAIVLFICAIDDFLALHDINKDYVSKQVLQYLEVETSKVLPDWTNTKLEWLSVQVSYIIRFISIIVSLIVLILLKRNIKNAYINQTGKKNE